MERILFSLVIGFLAILGIASVVEWAISGFWGGGCGCGRVTLLPVRKDTEGLEVLLRCAYNSMRWDRWITGGRLVIVDMGASADALAICETFASGRCDVHLHTYEEVVMAAQREDIYKTLLSVLY